MPRSRQYPDPRRAVPLARLYPDQTELVIMVTPVMAEPWPMPDLPTDDHAIAGDAEAIFLGHMENNVRRRQLTACAAATTGRLDLSSIDDGR